jgi:hypothetical protein
MSPNSVGVTEDGLPYFVMECSRRWKRRYASARRFDDDLQMHLEGARIEARPQSFFEPLLRFAGKKPAFLIGGVALAIALATGMVALSANAVRLALAVLGGG